MFAGDSNRINREYIDSLQIEFRHIDTDIADTTFTLFGETFQTPIMTAALSHLNNVYPNGMVEHAKGAYDAGAIHWVGMGQDDNPNRELSEIVATGARCIKIIKPFYDNDVIFEEIAHAKACGVLAVGMDLDHAMHRNGGYDVVVGHKMKSKSFTELCEFVRYAEIPFIVKGVLSETDASKCLVAGVQGMLVSHHAGIMNYAVPPLRILPNIAKLVNKQVPLFVDCSIHNGMDAFKALALGASGVCVGKAVMEQLKAKGAAGVTSKIEEATRELQGVMGFTNCKKLDEIEEGIIWKSSITHHLESYDS